MIDPTGEDPRPAGRAVGVPTPLAPASPIAMTASWTRDELVGYITTWSATARFVAAGGAERLEELRGQLAAIWPEGERRCVRWPLTVVLARR